MKEFQIEKNQSGQRLDKFLCKVLKSAPKSFIYKMLRKKNITLNEKKAVGNEILAIDDLVKLFLSDETFQNFSTDVKKDDIILEDLPLISLDIVYENEDYIVMNKPVGMLSQKAKQDDISANEYLLASMYEKQLISQESLRTFRPSICNRLDRNTSGLLIFGKSLSGLQQVSEWLNQRTVQKYYICVVMGELEHPMKITGFITKDEYRNKVTIHQEETFDSSLIETEYEPLFHCKEFSVLKVHLITGRSHQIRAHLTSIGHPILGDPKYDTTESRRISKSYHLHTQLLHAWKMITPDELEFIAPLPKAFDPFVEAIKDKVN